MKSSWLTTFVFGAVTLAPLWFTDAVVAAGPFRAGQDLIVARQNTPLMRGWHTLATLPQGQALKVLKTEGKWVGTSTVVNGRKIGGWVWTGHLATLSQYSQRRSAQRRYSYQRRAYYGHGYQRSTLLDDARAGRRLIMGYTPYGPAYWRADRKIVGY